MKKILLNNLKFKIIAVVLAFIIWAVVVNITDPTVTKTVDGIPITITNEEAVLDGTQVYTIVSGSTASVTITGSRSTVYRVMKPSAFVATADFSAVSVTGTVDVSVELSDEYSEYKSLVDLETKSQVTIALDSIESRVFTPVPEFVGTPAEGFETSSIIFDPEKITVYAPSEILKSIHGVVLKIDVADASADLNTVVEPIIIDYSGNVVEKSSSVYTDVDTVNVSAGLVQSKDVKLVATATGTVADSYSFGGITLSQETIKIKGAPDDIAGISQIDLGAINIDGATENVVTAINVAELLPNGVSLYDESQSVVTVTATIDKSTTKKVMLDSTSIAIQNLPSGYYATVKGDVTIEISGALSVIEKLTASSLEAYVDLSKATIGTSEYTIYMKLPTGVTASENTATVVVSNDADSGDKE
ncbi:MAG: hypothetical protein E7242_03895 [Lachnospiraceae bacterium]|nr:hypothetical protein [Lachnospiraceae bacterium]